MTWEMVTLVPWSLRWFLMKLKRQKMRMQTLMAFMCADLGVNRLLALVCVCATLLYGNRTRVCIFTLSTFKPMSVYHRGEGIWTRCAQYAGCSYCLLGLFLLFNLCFSVFQLPLPGGWDMGAQGGIGKGLRVIKKGKRCFDPFCLPLPHAKAIKKWVYMSVTRAVLTWLSLWLFTAGVREFPLHWEPAFLLTPITAFKW